jgi:hypothetical protein
LIPHHIDYHEEDQYGTDDTFKSIIHIRYLLLSPQSSRGLNIPMIAKELRPPPGFRKKLPVPESALSAAEAAAMAADPVSVTEPDM